MPGFIDELRRRNVIRVAGVYVVVGWLLAQVATTLEEALELPQWFDAMVLSLLLLCFPIALIISWALEMTPDGFKRTPPVDPTNPEAAAPGRGLDVAILLALVVSIGVGIANLVLVERTVPLTQAVPEDATELVGADSDEAPPVDLPSGNSIAVLPFEALSSNADDRYFGRGIAEELLNSLAQFPDLKVAARTSAFSFEGQNVDLREVGGTLGVTHVLEGSVRRSGQQLRITAQLIRAEDGFHLWSDTFDRELTDVFQVQDEIVAELSRVLQLRLGVGFGTGRVASKDVSARAYEQYLRGLDYWQRRETSVDNRRNAIEAFRLATELDPGFADAWAGYGIAVSLSAIRLGPPDRIKAVENAFNTAIALDPNNPRAIAGLAFTLSGDRPDIDAARAYKDQALALAPNAVFTQYAAAYFYRTTGDVARANRAFERAITLDPLNYTIQRVYNDHLTEVGSYQQTKAYYESLSECEPGACDDRHFFAMINLASAALAFGPAEEAKAYLEALRAEELDDFRPAEDMLSGLTLLADVYLYEREPRSYTDEEINNMSNPWADPSLLYVAVGDYERALDAVFEAYEAGEAMQISFVKYSDGRLQWPDEIRRHPRFHELWDLPGMQELAAARRANGHPHGLPLPLDEG